MINRFKEFIKFLKEIERPICIVGHTGIDVDSFCTTVLMKQIFDYYKIPNRIVIPDQIVLGDTYEIMSDLGYDLNDYKGSINKQDNVFIVDHYQSNSDGHVLGCIDHHPTIEQVDYIFYENANRSSCCIIAYDLMVGLGVPITKEIAELVVYSTLIDTCAMKSSKAVVTDKFILSEIVSRWNLDYAEIERTSFCLTDLTKQTAIVAENGKKSYSYSGHELMSSYIQVAEDHERMVSKIIDYLQGLVKNGLDMWVFLVVNMKDEITFEYRVTSNGVDTYRHNGIVSRGATIMPNIEKLFTKKEKI